MCSPQYSDGFDGEYGTFEEFVAGALEKSGGKWGTELMVTANKLVGKMSKRARKS